MGIQEPLFVMDLETTGFRGYPRDIITEIGIVEITKDLQIVERYNDYISYPISRQNQWNNCWWSENSGVKFYLSEDSPNLNYTWEIIKKFLNNQHLTSYNVPFDIYRFFNKINERQNNYINVEICKDPMILNRSIIDGGKYNLAKAIDYWKVSDNTNTDFHRAIYDARMTAKVILKMYDTGEYPL